MTSRIAVAGIFLFTLCLSSCSSNNADKIMSDQINTMNELAEAIENKAPDSRIKEIEQRLADNGKKFDDLKLSDDDKKKLVERHKKELVKATERLVKAGGNRAFGDFGNLVADGKNPFGNLSFPNKSAGSLKDQLLGKWLFDSAVVEFKADGTFDGSLPQFDLSDPVPGVYEWVSQEYVQLRKPSKVGKQIKVVILGDDITLITDNAVVVRGKQWTPARQKALDNERDSKEREMKKTTDEETEKKEK